MNNEIEVGEFVRTKSQGIKRIDGINENASINRYKYKTGESDWDGEWYGTIKTTDVVKHSKNIIDLIEVGDYVNGWKVLAKTKIKNNEMQVCILTCFEDEHWITINNETLKNIVTKESFKEIEYVF